MAGGINGNMLNEPLRHAGDGVDFGDSINFIAKEFHPNGPAVPVGGINLQGVPTEAEFVPGEVQVVAFIAYFCEFAEEAVQGSLLAHP